MRTLPVAVLLLSLSPAVAADLDPRTMEVGNSGPLWPAGKGFAGYPDVVRYRVSEVGDDWLAVRFSPGARGKPDVTFVVRGVQTKGLVDDREWKPAGAWKVEGTEKYKGKTVFTLRPVKD